MCIYMEQPKWKVDASIQSSGAPWHQNPSNTAEAKGGTQRQFMLLSMRIPPSKISDQKSAVITLQNQAGSFLHCFLLLQNIQDPVQGSHTGTGMR